MISWFQAFAFEFNLHRYIKDHMRKAGEPTYAEVFRDGEGMRGEVDFATADDMDCAINKLDDTEFKNPFDTTMIRVKEAKGGGGGGGGGGGSRGGGGGGGSPVKGGKRDYSRSRSKSRGGGGGKDRKDSRDRSRSRSRGRSRSRSPGAGGDDKDDKDEGAAPRKEEEEDAAPSAADGEADDANN
jgi:arginine/serine-rich splicing factor 1/9